MNVFLRLRPWQLFVLLFGLPMLVQLLAAFSLLLLWHWAAMAVGMGLSIGLSVLVFVWLWVLGTRLAARRPAAEVAGGLRWFKAGLRLAIGYILALLGLMSLAMLGAATRQLHFSPAWLALILPLHLLSMAGIFYALYFVARTLKAVELGRPVEFGDYLGDFFLLWFFPVGLWFIQPRVNQLFEAEDGLSAAAAG